MSASLGITWTILAERGGPLLAVAAGILLCRRWLRRRPQG
jgi:hypothetical protein